MTEYPILIDFDRPVGRPCQWCGYPFSDDRYYHIRSIDCPKHEPAHWKFYRTQAEREKRAK